jgi:hypothetical protein
MIKTMLFAGAALAIAAAAPAGAATITGLYNTGVNASYVSVTGVGVVDQHWTLADGTAYVSGQNGVFPLGPWVADTTTSRWITPLPVAGADLDPVANGLYNYSLTFSLAGYVANTASFSGRFAADNSVTALKLNGVSISGIGGGFSSWTNFDSSGGIFNAGENVLTFTVTNFGLASGNPSGLRVELTGTADLAPAPGVPEPQTWAMLVVGFGLVGVSARRRKAAVAA